MGGRGEGKGDKVEKRISNMEDLERGNVEYNGQRVAQVYFFEKYRGEVGSSSSGSNVTGIVVNIRKRFSALSFVLALFNFSSLRIFSYRIYICIYVYVAVEFLELNSVEFGYLYDLY